jgi:serine/threonine protein kinase
LKSANILIFQDPKSNLEKDKPLSQIGDFGLANFANAIPFGFVGTPLYQAPEAAGIFNDAIQARNPDFNLDSSFLDCKKVCKILTTK